MQTVSAHELVLEEVRTAIALGRFMPGEKLPRERDLASLLRVSRSTVREALAIMADANEIEVRRGRNGGLTVRDTTPQESDRARLVRENRKRLIEVFEFRKIVEGAGAGLAAERRTKTDIAQMTRLIEQTDDMVAKEDLKSAPVAARFRALDHEFHSSIARASRNSYLIDACFHAQIEMFKPVGAVFTRVEPLAFHLHRQILDAIVDGDCDSARSRMQEHIEETRALLEAWLLTARRSRMAKPSIGPTS